MNKIAKLLIGINRPGTGSVLYGWGYNAAYQLGIGPDQGSRTQVTLLDNTSSWTQLVTGQYFSAGIKSDGTLWTWGQGSALGDGQGILGTSTTPKRIGTSTWSSVSAGLSHVAAIRSDGRLFTWGFNFYGQLGDGTNSNKSSPVVIGTSSWTAVSAGASHTAAIRSDGTLWTWGLNDAGQLAQISSLASTSSPVQVGNTTIVGGPTSTLTPITRTLLGTASLTSSTSNAGDDNFWTLTLPWNVSFLGTSYGTLYVGTNMYITFGSGSTTYSGLSASNPALPKIALFAADRSGQRIYYGTEGVAPNRTYRIKFEGSTGTSGTLGSPTMGYEIVFYEADPTKFDIHMTHLGSTTGLLGIYTASALVQTITTSQLSLTNSVSITTGLVAGGTTPAYSWNQVSAGDRHTVAIRNDGTLWSWGYNPSGQLGDNTVANKSSPVQIGTGSWTQVRALENNTYAIDTNSMLWSWGRGDLGMLGSGSGTITYRSSPVQVGSNSWTSIGGGTSHVLAVRSDGTLWGWGDGTRYQLTLTSAVYSWSQIQSGDNHTVAIRSDGTLWAWGSGILGDGTYYQKRSSPVQIGTSSWKQVSAGRDHTVAIRSDDMLFTWGDNLFGQVGDDTVTFTPAPYQLGTDSWTQVSAGRYYTMAVRSDGGLFAWGRNKYGQFGDGTTTNRSSPIQIGTSSWSQVDAGWYHTAAIKSDGTLWGWGDNLYGQVGKHDDLTPANTYTQFTAAYPGTTDNGSLPVFAIKGDGTLWQWGGSSNTAANTWGTGETTTIPSRISPTQVGTKSWTQVAVQLQGPAVFGIDNTNNLYFWGSDTIGGYSYNTPTSLPIFAGSWAQITAGTNHQLGIKTDGTLWGWGDNTSKQIGDLALPNDSWVQIAGSDTRYGIKANGTLWGWGFNYSGTLGDRTLESRSSPVQIGTWVSATDSWVSVATAQFSAAAIDYTNTLWTWGAQNYGKLGNGINTSLGTVTSPVAIGAGYAKVFGGIHGFHAIKTDGTLWAWGYNDPTWGFGVYGDGTTISRSSPVQIGTSTWNMIARSVSNTYGIKSDGTAWGWGSQISRYVSPVLVSSISIGDGYGSGGWYRNGSVIDTNGKLYKYGGNYYGQLGNNTTIDSTEFIKIGDSSWSMVSSGRDSTMAIKADGTLWGWGDYTSIGVGTPYYVYRSSPVQVGSSTWSKVAAGHAGTALGIKSDGTLWSWGSADNGILGQASGNFQFAAYSPVSVATTGSWSQISVGTAHALAINDNGKLFAWGDGQYGATTHRYTHPTSWNQVTASQMHNAAIAFDGSLWTWGDNSYGQLGLGDTKARVAWPTKVGNSSWSQVAANQFVTAAIRADGTLWAWGYDAGLSGTDSFHKSSPVQIGTATNYSKIYLSGYTLHAIRSDGTLWAAGSSNGGKYGNGTTGTGTVWSSPVQIGSNTWKSISGGTNFRIAIRSDDTLWTWGVNTDGQLGDNTTISKSSPVQVGAGLWSWVRGGDSHVAARRQDGILFTWGDNAYGQLGDNTTISRSSPVQIGVANAYSDAICGFTGTVLQQGTSIYIAGQTGMQGVYPTRSSPVLISSGVAINKLESSNSQRDYLRQHVIDTSGVLYYSGYPAYTFGAGLTIYMDGGATSSPSNNFVTFQSAPTVEYPVQIGTSNWTYVHAGSQRSFAIRSDGKLFSWGRNTNGELGDNSILHRSSPVQIGTLNWSSVVSSANVTVARDSSNTLYTWGFADSFSRYLGDPTVLSSRSSPVQVGTTGIANSVAMGGFSTSGPGVFVVSGNSLRGWGTSLLGTMSTFDFTNLDGILSTYVSSRSPVVALPGSWVSVSAATSHALAVKSDGSLWTWGVNLYGQLGKNTTGLSWEAPQQIGSSSWTAVGTTAETSFAIDQSTRLFGWGRNDSYQLGDTTTINKSSPVQLGSGFGQLQKDIGGLTTSLAMSALTSGGVFVAWANNKYGSVGNNTANNTINILTYLTGGPLTAVTSPVQIGTANNWVQIAAGATHSLARNSSNVVYSWGGNSNSQCNQVSTVSVVGFGGSTIANIGFITATAWTSHGIPDTDAYSQPSWYTRYYWGRVPGTSTTSATITGVNDLHANGAAMQLNSLSVNYISNGMIGIANNNTAYFGTSNLVNASLYTNTVSKAFVLGQNTFAVVDSSTNYPYVWGHNNYGRTGINRDGTTQGSDEEFAILSQAVQIGGNGRVYSSPVQIGTSSWTQVAAGAWESLAIDSQSLLFGWGRNRYGTIGDGTIVGKFSPVQIGTSSWTQVRAGSNHAAAIDITGKLFTWGSNQYGQLGNGNVVDTSSPVQVGTSSWSFVTASSSTWGAESDHFTGAIRSDGVLYMWGAGDQGVIGNEAITNRSSPVQVGGALVGTVYSPSQIGSSSGWLKTTTGFGLTSLATKTNQ